MSDQDQLSPEEHARILREEILPHYRLSELGSPERPRAIILAGQPGSGKSGLVSNARAELHDDAVTVDPDALRVYHRDIEDFHRQTPYTWSGRTHPDASQWADELLEATTSSRRNLIYDTTLSNGPWASELITDLQRRGYDVEVRAIATHRLESELGVDHRFSRGVDSEGYGRHVPAGARDAIYGKLPESLDVIRAQTDVPIRIFDREGAELYDSRTSELQPGAALNQAREARLSDPTVTRNLRDGWQQQRTWHRDLPENLQSNARVAPLTRENLLSERSANGVVESVNRATREAVDIDYATRIMPARIQAGRALGVVGLALDAYEGLETANNINRLRGQGNDIAADSELIHFGSRSVGGFAGAGIGMAIGAAAGVETGPGLFVTGAIGGAIGVFAGSEIAKWTDNRKIYNQQDPQGDTWTHDPDQPGLGWQRRAPIDSSNDRIDNPAQGMLRAAPDLANRLNYQSSSTSAALIVGSPPVPSNPFIQPANASDAISQRPANWVRDAESNEWRRDVITYIDRGTILTRPEVAGTERAAQLDHAAAQTVLQNTANSRPLIAARYEEAYARNGWAAYGPIPDAVLQARTDLDSLVASDNNRYQRRGSGEWVSDGMLYDSTARGNLHDELEATRAVLGAALPPRPAVQAPPPMTEEDRFRDTLTGVYATAGVSVTREQLEASASAVRATWTANGIDPNSGVALQLKLGANGRYDQDSPIASLRLQDDGKTLAIVALTTTEEIHSAQDMNRSAPSAEPENGSALQPSSRPDDGAAVPRRNASISDANHLLDGMIARDPAALAAARDQPAGQDLRAQAMATLDRQQAQQAQQTQQAALIADTPDAPANPARGAR